ncbi:MAG: DUF2065 family protein [Pseudomonadota bacterium]|nr:DUF2065 family protein [Pseudomonadota bacterium]MED5274608.1 DUF2065 family protein [Pseudomonadota bacterium]
MLLLTLSIILILEGIIPFISPERFRKLLVFINECSNNTLRTLGLISIILGLILYWIVAYQYL